jgi:hypothetical protein
MDQTGQRTITQKSDASLPTPDKNSSFAQWQEAYNVYFTHYARMSPEYMESSPLDYRARENGIRWAHRMVDASLGVLWYASYAGTPPEKRDRFWKKLKDNSVFLVDETDVMTAGETQEPEEASESRDQIHHESPS